MTESIRGVEEMKNKAATFARSLIPHTSACIVALSGDLGSGKTTFVQGMAHALGVEEQITSPTFVIMKKHALQGQKFDTLIHIDAYRLAGAHELQTLGWDELVKNPHNLIVIEWPERVGEIIPKEAHQLMFKFIDEQTRLTEGL